MAMRRRGGAPSAFRHKEIITRTIKEIARIAEAYKHKAPLLASFALPKNSFKVLLATSEPEKRSARGLYKEVATTTVPRKIGPENHPTP